jgi:hypothetical protein
MKLPEKKAPDPGLPVVREMTEQFYRGDLAKLHSRFSDQMKTILTVDKLVAMRAHVEKTYGKEVAVVGEDWQVKDKDRGFVRWARFDKYDGVIQVLWFLHRDDDQVTGFFVEPAQQQPAESKAAQPLR